MSKQKFIKNSLLMTSVMLVTEILSALLNIYLSKHLGAEGTGIYHLALNVFGFCAAVCTSGAMLTVTRIVSECNAIGRKGIAKRAATVCSAVALAAGTAAAAALFTLSDKIAVGFLGDGRCSLSLKVLALGLPFMSVSACIRGYFLAVRAVVKSSADQLCEEAVRIAVCMTLITPLSAKGLEYACCAAAASISISEISSLILSAVLYHAETAKITNEKPLPSSVRRKLLYVGIPVAASSCLRSGLSMLENTLIPQGLQRYGFSYSDSLARYGIIAGMALPAISYPYILIASFASLMIPEMSEALAGNSRSSIRRMAKRVILGTLTYTLPVTVFFYFFADRIGMLLYSRGDVGIYIKILALTIPFSYMDHVVDGMLKGLNEQLHYFLYNIIDSAIRTALALFLIPLYGIRAIIIIIFISSILNSTLSTLRLLKVTELELHLSDAAKPCAAAVLSVVLCLVVQASV